MAVLRQRREPTSPGEILREEFLLPLDMTQKRLAKHLRCDVKVVNRLVNSRTSVSAPMALKLGGDVRNDTRLLAQCAEGRGHLSSLARRFRSASTDRASELTHYGVRPRLRRASPTDVC